MAQAKTLNAAELKQVLSYIAVNRHALRNRVMLLITHWSGMRVGEVAALKYCDVLGADGKVLAEVRLSGEMTKGNHARTVFFPERLRKEVQAYVNAYPCHSPSYPLFYTQKSALFGFSANTLCQLFFHSYRRAHMPGASSHSGRRTFITNLAGKGIGVRVLQSLAGHRNIGTTQAYIDVNDEMKRRAVELI